MPELVHKVTGARVSVSESTAARLSGVWVPAEQSKPEPAKSPARRTAKNKSND